MGLAFYNVLGAIGGFVSPYIVGGCLMVAHTIAACTCKAPSTWLQH